MFVVVGLDDVAGVLIAVGVRSVCGVGWRTCSLQPASAAWADVLADDGRGLRGHVQCGRGA